jgi:DNA polymerase-4
LWGVGKVTSEKLRNLGITTVEQVARLPKQIVVSIVGRAAGHHLHALAHNRDPRRVETGRRRRSVGAQSALGRRRRSPEDVDAVLVGLVDRVTRRLRKGRRVARTVVLRLRFDDFSRVTRSHTLPDPTGATMTILATARALFHTALPMIKQRGLTLVGIAVMNLGDEDVTQLVLPFDRGNRIDLDVTLDSIKTRFGSAAVTRGVLIGRDSGWTVPLLPE